MKILSALHKTIQLSKDNIEFSFDDWYVDDMKFAELLYKHWYKNVMFYIPIKNIEWKTTLSSGNIQTISKVFEIWGHTYHHIDLTTLTLEEWKQEIMDGKIALESLIGKQISSFCPPRGHFNQQILHTIRQCWFTDCRSARLYNANISNPKDFLWHPNIHFYHHPIYIDFLHSIKMWDMYSIKSRLKGMNRTHMNMIFDILSTNGKIHIWWHTWEIDFEEFKIFILNLNKLFNE